MSNYPPDFEQMYQAIFGATDWADFSATADDPVVRGVRIHHTQDIMPRLPESIISRPIVWCEDAFFITNDHLLGKDPLHAAGCYYIQEPSAMAPVEALAPQPGENVLDLCAAPGGKTVQIAHRMQNQGFLLANEPYPDRCTTLVENVERMGAWITQVTQIYPEHLVDVYPSFFDRILVDAPCSGEGMFRKDERAIAEWHKDLPTQNAERQLSILRSAYQMLKPGGILVYSTCTFNPIENEAVCLAFLTEHKDLIGESCDLAFSVPGLSASELQAASERYLPLHDFLQQHRVTLQNHPTHRYFPHSSASEGHFIARFCKSSAEAREHKSDPSHLNRTRRPIPKKTESDLVTTFSQWAQMSLQPSYLEALQSQCELIVKKEVLYAVTLPNRLTRGILRPGLPLLTVPHHHPIPTHALALCLHATDVLQSLHLPYGDPRILRFLYGETIDVSDLANTFTKPSRESEWILITIENTPFSWGKLVGHTIKNHYPKGLRRAYQFALHTMDE